MLMNAKLNMITFPVSQRRFHTGPSISHGFDFSDLSRFGRLQNQGGSRPWALAIQMIIQTVGKPDPKKWANWGHHSMKTLGKWMKPPAFVLLSWLTSQFAKSWVSSLVKVRVGNPTWLFGRSSSWFKSREPRNEIVLEYETQPRMPKSIKNSKWPFWKLFFWVPIITWSVGCESLRGLGSEIPPAVHGYEILTMDLWWMCQLLLPFILTPSLSK